MRGMLRNCSNNSQRRCLLLFAAFSLRTTVAFCNSRVSDRFASPRLRSRRENRADFPNVNGASLENSVCLVLASSDGKLPSSKSICQEKHGKLHHTLENLDMIYHAMSHQDTKALEYIDTEGAADAQGEQQLLHLLRQSLEDAGFQRLTQRDLDLCDALNVGYLLRLSIQPDVSDLDPATFVEMYPELVRGNSTMSQLLFDGRVLVYRRGYSSERTKGRLLLPKLDYLQASLVQATAFKITLKLGKMERAVTKSIARFARTIRLKAKGTLHSMADMVRPKSLGEFVRRELGWRRLTFSEIKEDIRRINQRENVLFKLARYGGSKIRFVGAPNIMNALTPFLICIIPNIEEKDHGESNDSSLAENATHKMYRGLNSGEYTCQYDFEHPDQSHKAPMPSALLERVSIGNVVDVFSSIGWRRMLRNVLSIVELVEPTYDEMFVIWRPLPRKRKADMKERIPAVVYDMAEIFDLEDKLPDKFARRTEPKREALQIRAFNGVPMANLPAVLPKTRLIFRPADAFLFDLISVLTFTLVLSSQRFDNPSLDLAAVISVSLWLIRTVLRYSNKLARYDLLVKTFLTSKIAHRNSGAVKYISDEAASQRATRASLLYSWLRNTQKTNESVTLDELKEEAFVGVNQMLERDQYVDFNVLSGLTDLEGLGLVSLPCNGRNRLSVADEKSTVAILRSTWASIFDDANENVMLGYENRTAVMVANARQ